MKRKENIPPNGQRFSKIPVLFTTRIVFPTTLLISLFPASITAQTIIPAQDGTGTQVNLQGNQFNINGGQLSGDGANLFHSFQKLGLSQGEILNFISNPTIQNILGRVTGGEASFINGLIQVTGGNSNLFLINPAGILFGESASLNIPASFTATTANSIGFGNQNWFQALGDNQWQTLVGTPSDFVFNPNHPGSLVNLGNLTVSPGESITLLAGTVLNTGTLSAPGGEITIAAVTGENLLRISQDGHLLNLELTPEIPQTSSTLTPLSLPQLLTGGNLGNANQVQVTEQGQVILTASNVTIPTEPGTTILSGIIDVSSPTQTGGSLQLTGNQIGLLNSTLDASGLTGGGTILIGGDYKGLGRFPTAAKTFISSDSFVNANALELGNGGNVIVWSEDLTQVYGSIQVRGGTQSGNGGFVETSSHGVLEINTVPDIAAPSGLGGTWLLDPNNIDIVDDTLGNTNLNETALATGEILFKTTDDNSRLSVFSLRSALTSGNVIVETANEGANTQDGNIAFQTDFDFNGIGGERNLTLNAIGNIILDGHTITDGNPGDVDKLNLNFNADFDNNNNGAVFIRNATINTNGGDFTATGQGNTNFRSGIWIDNTQLNTLGGDITLTGTSGTPTDTNIGVGLNQSTLNSEAGTINITGNSQGAITNNIGILLNNGSTLQSTTGDITLTGNSNTGLSNFGISLNLGNILTNDGIIQLTGTAAGSDGSVALYISDSTISSTGTGIIGLQGNNNATGNNNDGISIVNNSLISSQGTGSMTISGVSGQGNNSEGIFLLDGQIQTLDGDILVDGVGRGSNTSLGVFVGDGGNVISTGIGNITLDGLSSAIGSSSHGISLFGNATINATATGNISLVGTSSSTTNSQGIFSLDGPRLQVVNGNLSLTGVSTAAFNGQGILLGNSLLQSSGIGTINLSGTGNGSGGDSNGILLINAAQINSLSSGAINLQGRGAAVADSEGVGIFQGSQIQTNTGSILIDGVNNGGNTTSVVIGDNSPVTTTGSGSITISGNQNLLISSLTNSGGAINLTSSAGSVNSSFGSLNTSSAVGNGGPVTINAAGNITIGSINTNTTANAANTQAGSISLTSANDKVTVTNTLNTSATTGQGNNITISAPVQLTQPTTTFNTVGSAGSGSIIFNNTVDGTTSGSNGLVLQAGTGNISFNNSVGNLTPLNGLTLTAGNINSLAPINIATSGLRINASGSVNLADILATDNGLVEILAAGNITTQDIITNGATLTLTSSAGEINTQNGILDSRSTDNNGGNQIINASGAVTLGGINTSTTSNDANSQAGSLTISSGTNTINLTGDINTSATQGQGSAINFNANVVVPGESVTLTTTGNNNSGNVTFNGTVNGSNENSGGNLTVQTGESNVTFNQAVGDTVPLERLTLNSGTVVTQFPVTVGNGGVNITATQTVTLGDTVTSNNSPIEVVAAGEISTQDIISNGGQIALTSNNGSINTTAGILNSSSTTADGGDINLNAAQTLTLGEINTRTESNLGTAQAGALTLAGNTITLTNNIDTSATIGSGNTITFNAPVILDGETITVTTSGTAGSGDVTFNNTVDSNSPGNSNLNLQAGTGIVTFNQTVGGNNILNGLNVNSGDINSNAAINVEAGGVNLNSRGTVNLTAPVTATNTGTININAENNITTADLTTQGQAINLNSNTGNIDTRLGALNSSSTNSAGGDINLTTTATATLGEINTSTQTNQAGTLTVSGETIALTGNINASGNSGTGSNLTFNNPVEINQPLTLNTSGTAGSGTITFNNTVNSIPANTNGLTVQAGTGRVQFNNTVNVGGLDITSGTVDSTAPITVDTGNFRINSSDSVTLPQAITTINGSAVEITAANTIVTGDITTNGQPITLNSSTGTITTNPGTLNTSSPNNGGAITINSAGTLTLGGVNTSTTNGQAGTLTLNTSNNPIILNGDINTSASNGAGSQQQYNSPVQLASPNITLNSSGSNSSGTISFPFAINGSSNLILNAGSGNITFSTVGDSIPPLSLQVNTTGLTTLQGNLTVNTLDFSNASGGTQLANNIAINTAGTNGNILFNNSPITGAQTLTLNAGTGNISLNRVGTNNNPVNGLIFQQANTVNLFGDIYTTSGLNFSPVNTVNIAGNAVLLNTSINNGAINFTDATLTGQGILTLNAGNNDVNLDTFTTESPLNGLGITARTVQANAPITVGSGGLNINASNLVNLNANTLSNSTVAITATNGINTRDITAPEGITLNSNNGNITVNSLDTSSPITNGGDITLNTQRGDITTNRLNSSSPNGIGGEISLSSDLGSITTENLRTSGLIGGNVTVNAETRITAGQIDTQGQTQAGNVFLDPINDVQVEFINAESPNGRGGNVFVESTQGYFRATGSFPTSFSPTGTASISTAGRLGSGSITIRHAGGPLNAPVAAFEIGENLTVNGTAAAITTGNSTLSPPQSFEGSFSLGNIAIQTDDAPPSQTENPAVIQTLLIPPNQADKPGLIPSELINDLTNYYVDQELLSSVDIAFNSDNLDSTLLFLDRLRSQEFEQYLGVESTLLNRSEVQQRLRELELKTKQVYAIVYIVSRENQLEVIVVPSSGEPLQHTIPEATREKLFSIAREFQSEITNPRKRNTNSYQASAQQLYQWMIQPIEADLQKLEVSTLLFSLDAGLRSLPMAALWDGQQFLVEKYAISLIPSTSLIDFRYQPIGQAEVLAMGASTFQQHNPLPAVPVELGNIIELWPGEEFLNERFTLENLKNQRRLADFEVIHLATHADFKAGAPSNSYIQLWNEQLPLTELPNLNLDNPMVELLTLSACRTALGDRRSELGFAGLAVQAGVKSALASLWYVSDQGTLGLMSEFYQDLKQAPIKAIALQNSQIDMIRGTTRIENDQLITSFGEIPLPSELTGSNITNLSHPYYWSGFTLIGSPW